MIKDICIVYCLSYSEMTLYSSFMLAYVCVPRFVMHSDHFLLYFMLSVYTWGPFLTYVYTLQ